MEDRSFCVNATRRRCRVNGGLCWLVGWSLIVALLVPPAGAQSCPGDCSRDRTVSIDELVVCVRIALENEAQQECPECDVDADGRVTVDEVVGAVAASLRQLVVEANGMCVHPGPNGLIPCAEGTMVQVGRCDDRAACLRDSSSVVAVAADPVGANGSFAVVMDRCQVTAGTLVFEAEVQVETGSHYRTMDFGSIGGGLGLASVDGQGQGVFLSDLMIGPGSEGAVRVLRENGLENFDNQGANEIFDFALVSNDATDFAGLEPDAAANLAQEMAAGDPMVQASISRNRTLCTETEFTLRLDNGHVLQGIGVNNLDSGGNEGSSFIWLNRHIVNSADLPITITALSNIWPGDPSGLVGGESMEMLVYIDEDADGDPSNAKLAASQSLRVPTPDDSLRRIHPFDEPLVIDGPGDLYVGFADVQSGIDREIRFPALQDDSGGGPRSFIVFTRDSDLPVDVTDLGNNNIILPLIDALPGAWLLRADGMCGG